MTVGQQIVSETTLLADAIRTAPHAKVRKYPTWDLAQLGRHVGEIHGWVTGVVRDAATERPSTRAKLTDVPDEDIPGVLHIGASRLAEVLDGCDLGGPVWSFTGMTTNGFWCRRMLLETTIHRWDAQDAVGKVTPVPDEVALDGIDEALTSYAIPSLPDWDLSVSGASVVASGSTGSCTITGQPLDVWLLVMGRRRLAGLDVTGDDAAATALTEALLALRGPA